MDKKLFDQRDTIMSESQLLKFLVQRLDKMEDKFDKLEEKFDKVSDKYDDQLTNVRVKMASMAVIVSLITTVITATIVTQVRQVVAAPTMDRRK